MKFTITVNLLLFLTISPLVLAASIPTGNRLIRRDIPEGFTLEDRGMYVNGTIAGIPFEGYGTVQEVYAQFQEAHPDIDLNLSHAGDLKDRSAGQWKGPRVNCQL